MPSHVSRTRHHPLAFVVTKNRTIVDVELWPRRSSPTSQAIDGLEKTLAALGPLDQALAMDLRRAQDYFQRLLSIAFRASDLAAAGEQGSRSSRLAR